MRRLILVAGLLLAGCGARETLQPAPGQALPVKPYGASATPSSDDLLRAPPLTRPSRSDEVLQSSQERRSDDFDLPPPN
jgi:hypothetical protein